MAPLNGGAKDTTPPKLLEVIPQNQSLNFNASEVILRFDEFVQLKDLRNQLIVSPTLKTAPEITAEGKKLKIVLKKEELQSNTTYRIFFGNALVDMREGNPLKGLEYVFSTGASLDTLKLKGKVTDAFNQAGQNEILVGLYNYNAGQKSDSMIFKRPPDYIAKTDAGGNFSFLWLPPKKFSLVAFSDKNKNLVYDGDAEKVAFRSEELQLNSDSSASLLLFQEESSKLYLKKTIAPYFGKTLLLYNRKNKCELDFLSGMKKEDYYETNAGKEKDTLIFYYKEAADTMKFKVQHADFGKTDTVLIAVPKVKLNKKRSLQITNNLNGSVLPWKVPLYLTFFNMIDTQKTVVSKMKLIYKKDTAEIREDLKLSFTEPFRCRIMNKLEEGKNYQLKIDTAAIYDYQGRYNDSIRLNFKVQAKSELGRITLKLLLNKKQAYIIQLLSEKDVVVKEDYVSLSLSSSNATAVEFNGVNPAAYKVKVIFDDNANKVWDSGNYLRSKQPEKVFIGSKLIKALPDWDVEEEILVK